MVITAVVTVIAAYLIGSINFAVIFTNIFLKKDVRNYGSGNAGMTNVMRVAGIMPGLLTFICDALKGFSAAMLGKLMFDYILSNTGAEWALPIYGAYVCSFACIIGHVFPVFFNFKGGKGVATSVGIYAVCCPIAVLSGLAVFAVMMLITKIVSLSSLTAAAAAAVLSMVFYVKTALLWPQCVFTLLIALVIFLKHKDNIKRLISGEESKLRVRSKK